MPWVADVLRQAFAVSVAFAALWVAAFSRSYELLVRAKRAHTAATA
jgi:hypothetical protein